MTPTPECRDSAVPQNSRPNTQSCSDESARSTRGAQEARACAASGERRAGRPAQLDRGGLARRSAAGLRQPFVPLEADFFAELGGHSLIAARFVSFVRETPALATIRLQDVYEARNLRALAARLEARRAPETEPLDLSFAPPPLLAPLPLRPCASGGDAVLSSASSPPNGSAFTSPTSCSRRKTAAFSRILRPLSRSMLRSMSALSS